MDPAQVLPGKKHVVETDAPGSAPMVSPMGMPMSPHTQAPHTHAPLTGHDQTYALDVPATEFGSPAVFHPAGLAEPALRHGALLQPVHQSVPQEQPHILPVDSDSCSCCGNTHDGKETRQFDRGDDHHDHAQQPDPHGHQDAPHHAVHDSTPNTDVPAGDPTPTPTKDGSTTSDCCACCGEHHPGLDSEDGKPGTPVDSADSEDSEDSEDSGDSADDADGKPADENDSDSDKPCDDEDSDKPGDDDHGSDKPGDDSHSGKHGDDDHGSDKPGDDSHSGKHSGDERGSDECPPDHSGHSDHSGHEPNPLHPTESGLPPTAPATGKVPLNPATGGQPNDAPTHPQGVPGKPLTPTESIPKGQAVAQEAEPQLPRGTMAPPVSQRLAPLSPEGGSPKTPVKDPTFYKSAPPSGGGAPGSKLTPQQSAVIPGTPGEEPQLLSRVLAPMAPATVAAPQTEPPPTEPPLQSGVRVQMPPATVTPPPASPPASATPESGSPDTMPPPAYKSEKPAEYAQARQPAEATQPRQFGALTQSTPGAPSGTPTNPATNPATLPGAGTVPGTVPPNGNVGPDPNIKFDEAQYSTLIGVIAEVSRTLDDATSIDVVYLDAELHLQPTGQTWEPAVNLVTRGGRFGGSVDTESTNLAKTLSTFHTALEQAKEVFKETDDLAAYDATRFTSEYPGFNSGGLPGAV
jgi:hypothetical protein